MNTRVLGIFDNDPTTRLMRMRGLDRRDQGYLVNRLCRGSPIKPWPYGMKTSVAPICVVLGVSPGNSRKPEDVDGDTLGRTGIVPCCGTVPEGFDYQDTKHYWQKTSDLCFFTVNQLGSIKSKGDALALSGHLNLGTGQNGVAQIDATDKCTIQWVSNLLYEKLFPRVLIVWGLNGILRNPNISRIWNHKRGLKVDWQNPLVTVPFEKYAFRIWSANLIDGRSLIIVSWPNHPSRHPFAGGPDNQNWQNAKEKFSILLRKHLIRT